MPDHFNSLRQEILRLDEETREQFKGRILLENEEYLRFLRSLSSIRTSELKKIEFEFRSSENFFDVFLPRIEVLEKLEDAGDLRFHSFTLYALVRALRPRLVVETGVAHGKSSALILLALDHNKSGRLVSFDLPPTGELADGSKTSLSGREVGWLVPENLRRNWDLHLVDSKSGLNEMFRRPVDPPNPPEIDFFFHDSLHTFEHISAELAAVRNHLSARCLLLADNMEMESGPGFEAFCQSENLKLERFGNLGGARFGACA